MTSRHIRASRWGNSIAVRIPASIAQDLQIAEKTKLTVEVVDGAMLLRPISSKRRVTGKYRLEALLAATPDDAIFEEEHWGEDVGEEKLE